jgi:hypothetical protein
MEMPGPGKYDVKGIYVGYQASEIKGIVVGEGKTVDVTIARKNAPDTGTF